MINNMENDNIIFIFPHTERCEKFIECLNSLYRYSGPCNIYISYFLSSIKYCERLNKTVNDIGHKLVGYNYSEKTESCSYNWNIGIKYSIENNFEYIVICNDDILFSPLWLDKIISFFCRHDKIDCIHPLIIADKVLNEKDFLVEVEELLKITKEDEYTLGIAWGAMVTKRRFWNKIGLFDENFYPAFYEDIDMSARMTMNENIYYCTLMDSIIYHYCSSTVSKITFSINDNFNKYKEKWKNFNAVDYAIKSGDRITSYLNREKYVNIKRIDNGENSSIISVNTKRD